jgi:hypothetical protein
MQNQQAGELIPASSESQGGAALGVQDASQAGRSGRESVSCHSPNFGRCNCTWWHIESESISDHWPRLVV